jgi:lambda family phage portal protein
MGTALVPRLRLPKPTFADRVVEYFSPGSALRRLQARAMLGFATGGYSGARTDRKALKEWEVRSGSADEVQIADLATLRARSRDLVRNAPIATGALGTWVTSTVGTGLVPHASIDRDLLGLSEDEADAWERQAERFWWAWAGSPACDITRRHDFQAIQDTAFRSQLESGDILVIRRYRERPGELLGLKVQLIEADRISNPNFQSDTDRLVGGVETNADGEPLRYHVADRHPDSGWYRGGLVWTSVPAISSSGERMALHVFRPERPSQSRGVPIFAPVIEPLKQVSRYTDAELMAAVISAFFTVFIKSLSEGEAGLGLAPIDEGDPNPPAKSEYKLGEGAILDLAPGEDVEIANPSRPNDKFDPFMMSILRQVGVAIELPFELLIKHFTAVRRSSRPGVRSSHAGAGWCASSASPATTGSSRRRYSGVSSALPVFSRTRSSAAPGSARNGWDRARVSSIR